MWYVDTYLRDLTNSLPRTARGGNQSENIAAQSQHEVLSTYPGQLFSGVVTRAGAGTYDVAVMVSKDGKPIGCNVVCSTVSYLQGTSDCHLPTEGSEVIVFKSFENTGYGVIIGTVPPSDKLSPLSADNKMPQSYVHLWDCEPGAGGGTEAAYVVPFQDAKNPGSVNAHAGRPNDILPGNQAWINEQGVGMAVLNLILSLKGSDRARIDLSCLDDTIRLISGYYRHIHAQGEDQVYNDGGRLTREVYGTSNQWEKYGQSSLGPNLWAYQKDDPAFLGTAREAVWESVAAQPLASKKRFQIFTGYLGDLINLFIATPDPTVKQETQDNDSMDQGLMHTHIDETGRMQVRSASGISIERCDRIPVPKKKHEPWDPEGDKMEDIDKVEAKGPYVFTKDYPGARALQMQNARAWRNKQAYQRLHEQAQSSGRKDFYLPEEKEMRTPDDLVDEANQVTADFSKNANRKAYINVEDDGSIIMRDAWGSEIIMGYGGITINCAGNIMIRSGQSTVVLAGKDFIGKAKNCMDLSATDKDVRIKAENNMQIHGKGVLVESTATVESAAADNPTGVILKAKDSRILAIGKKVHLAGKESVLVDGKDDQGKMQGNMYVAVKEFNVIATEMANVIAGKEAGLLMTPRSAALAGGDASLVGGANVAVLHGAKAWVPLYEADMTSNFYAILAQYFVTIYNIYITGNGWLDPFNPSNRYNVEFLFRSSSEYGTLQAMTLEGASEFHVYQATWTCLANQHQSMLSGVTVVPWKENSVNDTYPWPGADIYDRESGYVKVDPESNKSNIEDFQNEIAKIRKEVVNQVDNLKAVGFDEYEVAQT